MPVQIENRRNATTTPSSWSAFVVPYQTLNIQDMAKIVAEKNSTYSEALIVSISWAFFTEVETQLLAGNAINLEGAMSISLQPKGRLVQSTDTPDANVTNIKMTASEKMVRSVSSQVTFTSLPVQELVPIIEFQQDSTTELTNYIAAGSIMHLTGERLRFDTTDSSQGLYVKNTMLGTEEKSVAIGKNNPAETIAIPVLNADASACEHDAEIRTRLTRGGSLRIGTYPEHIRSPLTAGAGDYPISSFNGIAP